MLTEFILRLPDWISPFLSGQELVYKTDDRRMSLAIELASLNVKNKTGGPFGACIFQIGTGKLISCGVNLVTSGNCSIAHAEMVAIAMAQRDIGTYNLASTPEGPFELVTSTEPCAMCLGAIPWSGVTKLVCGASDADARAIGFDEGDKPSNWTETLGKRGITVLQNVLGPQAKAVLDEYRENSGEIYNASKKTE
jgi:tRNA(Arg) A34 adenosine deaminase TadA